VKCVVCCREKVKHHWEQQKKDSEATKQRRQRMEKRIKLARAQRVAQALATQWPAHIGITRQDVFATVSFVATMSCIAWYWVGSNLIGGSDDTVVDVPPSHVMQMEGACTSVSNQGGQARQ
jgi:hypothetical protein